ncbi:caspase family protein [Amycolatopsis sp. NPDC049868]|uniref:caspase family protein n=1 Tax=Amycolatopsis sp. NPDC049868 TaxID=3363934 RepID=UPI0037893BDD
MAGGAAEPVRGRRYFVSMAVNRHKELPPDEQLTRSSSDAECLADLLATFGYERALQGMGNYWTAEHVRSSLSGWSKDAALGADDVVVFYFAGHGLVADRDRHYLMCWDSSDDDPAATALATEDLVRILTRTGLRNLLVVLDTCYGGTGAADGAQLVLRTISRQLNNDGSGGVWLLSSARAKDEAGDGTFMESLLPALHEVRERTGQRQRFLDLIDVVDSVNQRFRKLGLRQRAELAAGMVTGLAPFLDNVGFRHNLPAEDTDLELQRLLAKRDLHDHFGPRARGVEFDSEPGLYFHGRRRILAELVAWLVADSPDGKGRVVTGTPGCGKSAVVGRIVAMSDPAYRRSLLYETDPAGTQVPPGIVQAAVHSRHKLLPEIVQQIASAIGAEVDGPGQLLREISLRARDGGPLVIVVDALDEAGSGTAADAGGKGEPRRIARELLRPMSEIPGVRLLVGTRAELVSSLGASFQVLNLDNDGYLGEDDIAEYVTKLLLAENEPEVTTPYRGRFELARTVGDAVAGRAAGVFLVARMTARGLRSGDDVMDVSRPNWEEDLPSEIGEAFEDYLSRFGPDESRVRALLTPLAFAEGQGLPRGLLWIATAEALWRRSVGDDDIDWLLDKAAAYVAEVTDQGRSVYRLYHQALAEHLRAVYRAGVAVAQDRIVSALLATVSRNADGRPDWFSAHQYLRAHLATHAAAAVGRLDELVHDPSFLLVAEQLALLRAFPHVVSPPAQQARNSYEQAAHQLGGTLSVGECAAYLQLSARRCGAIQLAEGIDRLALPMPWRTRWAWWSPTGVHRQLVGHERGIRALTAGELDGRPVVLTGGDDGTARIWDLITQRSLGEPLPHGSISVTALAVGELGEYSVALTGGDDGRLRIWDISSGRQLGEPLRGHTNEITSVVFGAIGDRTIAVSASKDGTARVWDLDTGRQIGEPFTDHCRPVNAVTWTELDGKRIALTAGDDRRVRVWDVESQRQLGEPLIGHRRAVTAVALTTLDGRTAVVTGSGDGTIGLWDLGSRQQVGEPLIAHPHMAVRSLTSGVLDGIPIAISCVYDSCRVWNLASRQQLGQPLAGHDSYIDAVVLGAVDRRPIAITGGADRTARIWDLTADQPLIGHTGAVASLTLGRVNGRNLALTGGEDTAAVVWNLDSGGRQDGPPLSGHRATVGAVALGESAGMPVAVTGDEDAVIRIWDLRTRRAVGPPLVGHTGPVRAILLARVGGEPVLATGSEDGTVRLWDPRNGTLLCEPLSGHSANVDLLAFTEVDGRAAVIAATIEGHATVWDLAERRKISIVQPTLDRWGVIAVGSLDAKAIALFAGNDNSLMLWDLGAGQKVGQEMIGHTNRIAYAAFAERDGKPIAVTGSSDAEIRVWDLNEHRQLGPPLPGDSFRLKAVNAASLDTDTVVISCGVEQVRLWSLDSFRQIGDALHGADNDTFALTVGTVDGRTVLFSVGEDGTLRIRDVHSGAVIDPVLNGHKRYVGGVGFIDSDGPVAVTVGMIDGTARIWDLAGRREKVKWSRHQPPTVIFDESRILATARRGGRAVVATAAGADLQVWDLKSHSLLAELTGHTGRINSVVAADLAGLPILLTASLDSTARLWNLDTLEPLGPPLAGHEGSVHAAVLGVRGDQALVFTGDHDGVIRAWNPTDAREVSTKVPRMDKWVSCLAATEMHGHSVLVVGGGDGTLRVWCQAGEQTVANVQLNVTPTDIVVLPEGDICVSTSMGIVAMHLSDWVREAGT